MTNTQKIIKYAAIALALALVIGIFSSVFQGISLLIGNVSDSVSGSKKELSSSIDKLSIELDSADLTLKTGEKLAIEYDKKHITVTQKNGSLEIEEKKRGLFRVERVAGVVLTLPEELLLEQLEIETGAGKIEISDISADKLSLELGAGNVSLERIDIKSSADIDGGAGNITVLDSAINGLDLEMGVGNLDLEALLSGNSGITFGIGKATLTLLGSENDYMLRLNKGLGKATFNGEELKSGVYYGQGKNELDMSGGIGEITIVTQEIE